jgi:hypothetical protein
VVALDLRTLTAAAGPVHRPDQRVTGIAFADEDVVVTASWDGTVKASRLEPEGVQVLAGYPLGAQVSALAVSGVRIVAGLAGGRLAGLCLHRRRSPGTVAATHNR